MSASGSTGVRVVSLHVFSSFVGWGDAIIYPLTSRLLFFFPFSVGWCLSKYMSRGHLPSRRRALAVTLLVLLSGPDSVFSKENIRENHDNFFPNRRHIVCLKLRFFCVRRGNEQEPYAQEYRQLTQGMNMNNVYRSATTNRGRHCYLGCKNHLQSARNSPNMNSGRLHRLTVGGCKFSGFQGKEDTCFAMVSPISASPVRASNRALDASRGAILFFERKACTCYLKYGLLSYSALSPREYTQRHRRRAVCCCRLS